MAGGLILLGLFVLIGRLYYKDDKVSNLIKLVKYNLMVWWAVGCYLIHVSDWAFWSRLALIIVGLLLGIYLDKIADFIINQTRRIYGKLK